MLIFPSAGTANLREKIGRGTSYKSTAAEGDRRGNKRGREGGRESVTHELRHLQGVERSVGKGATACNCMMEHAYRVVAKALVKRVNGERRTVGESKNTRGGLSSLAAGRVWS